MQKLASTEQRGRRIAALDLGSNSFHLLVVEVSPDGAQTILAREREMVRLGDGTFENGTIGFKTFTRGIAALRRFSSLMSTFEPEVVIAVATSALREARNAGEFLQAARRAARIDVRVIDSDEEARFVYLGARSSLRAHGRIALFDLGGGSTEAILGEGDRVLHSASLKLGVLRMRDAGAELSQEVEDVARPVVATLRDLGFEVVAFSSGTADALGRLAEVEGLSDDPELLHTESRLSLSALRILEMRLARMSRVERAALPGLDPRRADTIASGATILRTLLELSGARYASICNTALREGVVADYIAQAPTRRFVRPLRLLDPPHHI